MNVASILKRNDLRRLNYLQEMDSRLSRAEIHSGNLETSLALAMATYCDRWELEKRLSFISRLEQFLTKERGFEVAETLLRDWR